MTRIYWWCKDSPLLPPGLLQLPFLLLPHQVALELYQPFAVPIRLYNAHLFRSQECHRLGWSPRRLE